MASNRLFVTLIVYALLLLAGGLIGFLVANSVASLVMSSCFAVLILLFALMIRRGLLLGIMGAAVVTALLSLFFAWRFYQTGKWIPGGAMLIFSLIVFLFLLYSGRQSSLK